MILDIKLGIVWALIVGLLFDIPLTLVWFLWGILFALLPDLDFIIEYIQRGTVGSKHLGAHRLLFHNPLTFLPVGLFLGYSQGLPWTLLFFLGTFGHFIHDTMGMGFGVRWLWPFSQNFYKIFSDPVGNIHYDRKHLSVTAWSPEEVRVVIEEKGNDNWLREDFRYHRERWVLHLGKFAVFTLFLILLYTIWRRGS